MPIQRGNPPGMKNVRATVYNHFVRVDQPEVAGLHLRPGLAGQ